LTNCVFYILSQINDVSNNDLPLTENENNIFKMLQQENNPGSVFSMQDIKKIYIKYNRQNVSTS